MKPKSKNRLLAGALALFMAVTSISAVPIGAESAGGGETAAPSTPSGDKTYVLEGSNLEAKKEKELADGEKILTGEGDYFTLYGSQKMKIKDNTTSTKKFDDDYESSSRINFGGVIDISTPKDTVEFTTQNPASVTVWWIVNTAGREITALDSKGETVFVSTENGDKNKACVTSFELPTAGKYYLGNIQGSAEKAGGNYWYKVEVTEHLPKEYILDTTADLTAASVGAFADGESAKAGTENYFTMFYSASTKIDGSKKSFDDGYSATQRINFGGTLDTATPKMLFHLPHRAQPA